MQQDIQTSWGSFYTGKQTNISQVHRIKVTDADIKCRRGVTIKAAIGNPGMVYVGNSSVVSSGDDANMGYELDAGESITINVDHAAKVYVIADSPLNHVFWVAV